MKLVNRHGEVSVQPLGAMLHDCVFILEGGCDVRPLYDAPWRNDSGPEYDALPPIIRSLGSEWPCVPFGRTTGVLQLPPEWVSSDFEPWDNWAHGYCSNNEWRLHKVSAGSFRADISYPQSTPIERLERRVTLLEDRCGLDLSLTVHARRETTFPLGLHPVLSMEGAASGAMTLKLKDSARVWSFPTELEEGCNHFVPNQHHRALQDMLTCMGGTQDVRNLPPDGQTEDLLFLTGTEGSVGLINPVQKCLTTINWNADQISNCLLWISNGGRNYYPWNGSVAALGIEPVASAFDLGMRHSLSQKSPLGKNKIATSVTILPDQPVEFHYNITVEPCGQ